MAALVALVSAAVPAFLAWGFTKYDTSGYIKEYFDVAWKIVGVWMLLVVLFYLLFCSHRKKYTAAVIGCCVVVMASSGWINPIAQGTGAVTKSETMQTIRDIVKSDPSAIWLTVDLGYPGTNIPAMAGADCFNTTQTYPQKERWTMLDESGEYEDFYNRYCHIGATLGSETSFELLNTDYVNVTLSPEKFKELKIKYVVSRNSIDEKIVSGTVFGENQSSLPNGGIEFKKCYSGAELSIYECIY